MVESAANRSLSADTVGPPPGFPGKVAEAVSAFGVAVREPLAAGIGGEEYQIQDPVARLVRAAGDALGLRVTIHKEVSLPDLSVRPDFAVDLSGGRVGHIEVKAPSKSPDPKDWPARSHDRIQWQKLSLLPNVLLCTGQCFALYRNGVRVGRVAELDGALDRAGRSLRPADDELARILHEFLTWAPDPPRGLRDLVRTTARLCRYLREEVMEVLEHERLTRGDRPFTTLAEEWRSILFPRMTEPADFADSYAQTITFALLLARAVGVSFDGRDLPTIGRQLGKQHALIGKALGVLSDPEAADNLFVTETLKRVIGAVDWDGIGAADINAHALLYETFLTEYDPKLRRLSGSYYTPDGLAAAMVRFTDLILKGKLNRPEGYAADDVIVVDPAMGTGTFLVEIVRSVVQTVRDDGAEQSLRHLFQNRLIGFERQVTPYAVAELRLHDLLREYGTDVPPQEMRFFADTFDDPDLQEFAFGRMYAELLKQRTGANRVKRHLPVMAIIGNPPYLDRAHTRDPAPWIEDRRDPGKPDDVVHRPSLDEFRQRSRLDYKLAATWVFYWRWAIWKAFEAHPDEPAGLVAFITPSSYLSGAAFAGMRKHLREVADEGWIIDLTPEGHQPPVPTRLFPKVQQPLAIAVFIRKDEADPRRPAEVRHRRLTGLQEQKLAALAALAPDSDGWTLCPDGWTAEFRPPSQAQWHTAPLLADLLPWHAPGTKAKRTWVIAPSTDVLQERWTRLTNARPGERDDLMKRTRDRDPDTRPGPIPGQPHPASALRDEPAQRPNVVPFAYRSFDRQYLILDPRVVDFPSPDLWRVVGEEQVYASEQHTNVLREGVALTFAPFVPDMDHFQGHHGGRVLPLYRDAQRTPNVAPGLSRYLSGLFDKAVADEDVFAYIAAVAAHSGYTRRFRENLVNPGLRIPLTGDAALWSRAVELGRTVVWLHTYGTRFADESKGRPRRAPRLPDAESPRIRPDIPASAERMPDSVGYDEETETLLIGDEGRVGPVPPEVWAYNVGGMRVVAKWVGYRLRRPRRRKAASPLDLINAREWDYRFNNDLRDLLHVLGLLVRLEPEQDALLGEICAGPLVTVDDLKAVPVLPVPKSHRVPIKPSGEGGQMAM
ncbi:N-6 DNA methylase [Actinomadura sp. LD22]|uniref:site-specific DNA-methyltransferase (adenine-specific) n=1 Tax=Actinomadura physcomitrii TaxID=2650748 RepID=A0A6I4MD75_9ACTN|nr:type ISP restriction/modification enzyme [Actinomadura physcomitrii]MWA01947.1 N-6 DNA methylase [Actinomadura physcomitrii]